MTKLTRRTRKRIVPTEEDAQLFGTLYLSAEQARMLKDFVERAQIRELNETERDLQTVECLLSATYALNNALSEIIGESRTVQSPI